MEMGEVKLKCIEKNNKVVSENIIVCWIRVGFRCGGIESIKR